MNKFYVGLVCEVQNDVYFKVKLFAKQKLVNGKVLKFYLSSNVLSTLFPCKWCAKYNLVLENPNDWDHESFDWDIYIDRLNAQQVISTYATTDDLSIYNWNKQLNNLSDKFQVGSLFPVGWCEMNNFYGSYDRYIRSYPFPNSNKDSQVSSRIRENLRMSAEKNMVYFSQFKSRR